MDVQTEMTDTDGICVRLIAMCEHTDSERIEPKEADFWFLNWDVYQRYEDDFFDGISEDFEEYLRGVKGDPGWIVVDAIESFGDIPESEAVNPVRILE